MADYSLLFRNTKQRKRADRCAKSIDQAIIAFGKRLAKIAERYPDLGIGDTATDEQIANVLYSHIHFNYEPEEIKHLPDELDD